MDIEKKYGELKKKHNLPELKELQKTFGIGKVDEEPVLSEIRKRIDDKTEFFLKILNRMLQPDTTISDMQESEIFTDNDKKDMFSLYKKLMIMHNSALLLEVDSDEKKEAGFISDALKGWPSIRKSMAGIVAKMKESWKEEIKLTEDIGYLG